MSDPTSTAVPQFVDPPPMPGPDAVQARMARFDDVLKADPSKAGEIEALVKYRLNTEAGFKSPTSADMSAMLQQGQDSKLEKVYASAMQAPADPVEYVLQVDPRDAEKPEVQQQVAGLRAAMFDAKLPTHVGSLLSQSIHEQSERYRNEPFEKANAMIEADRARAVDSLRTLWGNEFDGRVQRLQSFMLDLATRHPAVREAAPMLQMNATALAALSDVVEYRARR